MKLSSKIVLLTAALLGFLGGNAVLSWQETHRIQSEFNEVVKNDLTLMEFMTSLNDFQLKKEILFEKLASSAEELAFGNSNESRKQYLLDYVKDLQEQFSEDSAKADEQIEKSLKLPGFRGKFGESFQNVQKTVGMYDRKVESIFKAVTGPGYQLSMEDLDQIETQQVDLASNLQDMLAEVWTKVNASVDRINDLHRRSQQVLWISLLLSFIFALILAAAIIHRIHTALKILVQGVRELHQGKLGSHVVVRSSDEIGELAQAFNRMSDELKAYKEDMQRKNVELAGSLAVTREQKSELEKINRDLDRFVHLISHDIHGPIMAVIFYADYLKKQKEHFDVKTQGAVDNLIKVSGRLNTMVVDLLEMTKITRSRRPFEKLDISLIVQEALQRQEFLIEKTSAVINLPDSFPSVMADRLKLTVVFFNLIGNAVKYSSKGATKPRVDISWQKRLSDHMFCIKDNGIGIPREHYHDIFDMYKRLPDAEGFEGSGVGLAIVKEIIQEHGGQIWVDSTPGQGTQFFFTIPLESPSGLS